MGTGPRGVQDGALDVGAWVDRLTLSQRKLLFAVVAAGLIGLGVLSLRLSAPGPVEGTAVPRPSSAPALTAPAPATGTENQVVVEGLDADKAQLALSDTQVAAAQTVAERFCLEYATRRWDEPPPARLARLTPFMSKELAAAFASSSGGAALENERRENQEVTTAQSELAYPQSVSHHQVVFTVVVLQKVTTIQGTQEQRPSFQVVLEPRDDSWHVVNLVA
ncbi:MAG: hypothetical protein ACRDYA_07080 [Egibacteraceae bacterium]